MGDGPAGLAIGAAVARLKRKISARCAGCFLFVMLLLQRSWPGLQSLRMSLCALRGHVAVPHGVEPLV